MTFLVICGYMVLSIPKELDISRKMWSIGTFSITLRLIKKIKIPFIVIAWYCTH